MGVAHHQRVGVHGVQGHRRVDQGLALLDRARGDRHVDDVGAQALAGQLEGGAGARRFFEEQVDHRLAGEQRQFAVGGAVALGVGVRQIEQVGDLVGRQVLNAEQVAVVEVQIAGTGYLGMGAVGRRLRVRRGDEVVDRQIDAQAVRFRQHRLHLRGVGLPLAGFHARDGGLRRAHQAGQFGLGDIELFADDT